MFSKDVFFEPWVGKNYGTERAILPKKLLVLGDSHYCDDCDNCGDRNTAGECVFFTQETVFDYLNPEHKAHWKRTYSKFINSLYGRQTSIQERQLFFDSISFYNFLQVSAGTNPHMAATFDYGHEKYLNAFVSVLTCLSPDVVIAWGKRVRDIIPEDIGYGKFECLQCGTIAARVYPFAVKKILFIGVYHPSSSHYQRQVHYQYFQSNGIFVQ